MTLSLRRVGRPAELVIANTGPGIPRETLPRVFDPFFRADPSHSRPWKGAAWD